MSSFVEYRLPELLKFIVDNRGRTCPTSDDGIPLIATNCVKDGHFYPVFENVRHVDSVTYKNWFRSHPEPGDILFVCKGSPGRIAMVPDPVTFCIAQDMLALRADETIIDNRYLYYLLKSRDTQDKIANLHVGTMIPHFKKGDFGKLALSVHSTLSEQRAIAEVLGALDDKIAANTKLAETLSQTLSASYQKVVGSPEAFVPFSDLVTVTKGISYRSVDLTESTTALVTLKSFDRTGGYSPRGLKEYSGPYKPQQVIRPGELVVAQTDLTQAAEVVGRAVRVPASNRHSTLAASLDLAIVRPIGDEPEEFLLGTMLQGRFRTHCQSLTSGTTVLHLKSDAIQSFMAPLVSREIQLQYAALARPMLHLGDSIRGENETLAANRDTLLPQLMSGKLRVKDIENTMGEMV
ncbi:restriction endonuclease subunit S [Arthrobacter caoxuetaonis]|uniref:Restriction endonuclease subunit S n=1 Tax=Arthrobacter caoxuetaonis TaxID=2886935 RepID=A0A9X1SDH2_9MICC|nr:restriction endonuclease subunit S [Arthrobacter caoxuetaonis]MCC3296819.1 restriction endonuclease subunit S [Arthrobacter caoxuetaonis]USQ56363.1 restriction endonuclease subunit S [Arthrobacter caoxuetaonis]